MSEMVNCPICGTEFDLKKLDDCPYCDWTYVGYENDLEPDEKECFNTMTVREAKENFKKGKNIWGEPLPKKL